MQKLKYLFFPQSYLILKQVAAPPHFYFIWMIDWKKTVSIGSPHISLRPLVFKIYD